MLRIKGRERNISRMMLLIMIVMLVISPLEVMANDNKKETSIAVYREDSNAVTAAIKEGNQRIGKDATDKIRVIVNREEMDLISFSGDAIKINETAFNSGPKREVTKAMTGFVDSLKESDIPVDRQQAIMNEIQDVGPGVSAIMLPIVFEGTKGNIFKAYKVMSPILEFLSDALGIGAIVLIGLVLASTIMDLAYIGLPMWREAQAEGGKSGKKPFMVSHEALSTVQEVEKSLGENYQNAYIIYFKRRAITYVILAFCIMYLIGGQLSGIISFILNLASGITG